MTPERYAGALKLVAPLTLLVISLSLLDVAASTHLNVWADSTAEEQSRQKYSVKYGVNFPLHPIKVFCRAIADDNGHELEQQQGVSVVWKLKSAASDLTLASGTGFGNDISTTVTLNASVNSQTLQCVLRTQLTQHPIDWATVQVAAIAGLTPWSEWSVCEPVCGQSRFRRRRRSCFNPAAKPLNEVCPKAASQATSAPCDALPCPTAAVKQPQKPIHVDNGLAQRTEERNLRIIVACSSGLIGSLLLSAVIACWRRLQLEQQEQQRQLLQPEATEPRYHGLNDQRTLRVAPPPTYHETYHLDISQIEEVEMANVSGGSLPRTSTPLSPGNNPTSRPSSPNQDAPTSAASSPTLDSAQAVSATAESGEVAAEDCPLQGDASIGSVVAAAAAGTTAASQSTQGTPVSCRAQQTDQALQHSSTTSSSSAAPAAACAGGVTTTTVASATPRPLATSVANSSSSPTQSHRSSIPAPGSSQHSVATAGSDRADAASTTASLAAAEPVDILQRTAITCDYVVDHLKSGITEDECPMDSDEDLSWCNLSDTAPLM